MKNKKQTNIWNTQELLTLLQILNHHCYDSIRYIHVGKDRKSHTSSGFNGLVNLNLPLNEDVASFNCWFSSVVILNLACQTLTQAAQRRFTEFSHSR